MITRRDVRCLLNAVLLGAPLLASWTVAVEAQQPNVASDSSYQRYAPIDLTGMWVSIVTEEWAQRMIAPPKGDFEGLPLTKAAQDAATAVDMAKVAAAGRACDAYGAPVIMRQPGRIRIAWLDANTLRIETDAGEQTRLLRFDASQKAAARPSRQGSSVAEWQYANGFDPLRAGTAEEAPRARATSQAEVVTGRVRAGTGEQAVPFGGPETANKPRGGKLKVTTTNLTAGFLRKNGVPYSAKATMMEYYNVLTEPTGTKWLVVTTVVHDPENLAVDYITSTNFRQEPDKTRWHPEPCSLK